MKPVDVRRAEALTRNTAWAALSPEQQLQRLDALSLAAKQQRARLSAQLSSAPPAKCPRVEQRMECVPCGYPLSEAMVPTDHSVSCPNEPKPKKPRHKKGKRGDGRHA